MQDPRRPVFLPLDRAHPLFEAIVPLLALRKDGSYLPSGSAFVIGPGLAITALHVIQDYSEELLGAELTKESRDTDDSPLDYSVVANQVVNGRHVLWHVVSMWAATPLDMAVLTLIPARTERLRAEWSAPKLRFAPPRVGQDVFGVGFPKQHVGGVSTKSIQWHQEPFLSAGQVDEIHPQLRDAGRLRFPCFRTNARFDGSMSGGPVITDEGEICGVICSNLPPYDPTDAHVSYASLLWPLLAMEVRNPLASSDTGAMVTLKQLCSDGFLTSDDWHLVTPDPDGRTVHLLLPPN